MASSIDAIRKQIQRAVKNSMNETRNKTSKKLDDNLLEYYDGGEPMIYDRTGTLIDASNVTPVSGGGDSYEFKAEMDGDKISYSTGRFSGSEVVDATEMGTYGVVGSPGYWKKTEAEIPRIVDAAFSKRFG